MKNLILLFTLTFVMALSIPQMSYSITGIGAAIEAQDNLPVVDAQDAPVKQSFIKQIASTIGLDGWGITSILLGALSLFAGAAFLLVKTKLRAAGQLLIMAADAIEDKKIDANEQKALAQAARDLISKNKKPE
jgi:hypothetical protein